MESYTLRFIKKKVSRKYGKLVAEFAKIQIAINGKLVNSDISMS